MLCRKLSPLSKPTRWLSELWGTLKIALFTALPVVSFKFDTLDAIGLLWQTESIDTTMHLAAVCCLANAQTVPSSEQRCPLPTVPVMHKCFLLHWSLIRIHSPTYEFQ